MKPFDRPPHFIRLAAASVAIALAVPVLASASVRRADTAAWPANFAAAAAERSGSAIRPFRVSVAEAALVDLRQRIAATRWPEKETVSNRSQGAQLARLHSPAGLAAFFYDTFKDWTYSGGDAEKVFALEELLLRAAR